MKRTLSLLAIAGACAAAALDISLTDAEGRPLDPAGLIELCTKRSTDALGVETVQCSLRGLADATQLVQVVATVDVPRAETVWDGLDEVPAAKASFTRPLLIDGRFLMGAAWDSRTGVALASGADDFTSYEDLIAATNSAGVRLSIAVHAALLGKGSECSCTFHRFTFSPKYGIRDAFARYYPFHPARFTRNPAVNPAVYGISAHYASWRDVNPELCRFANASWEWCYGAGRSWGDPLGIEDPAFLPKGDLFRDSGISCTLRDGTALKRTNAGLPPDEYARVLDIRFANGNYCGVANAFYLMALANISRGIAWRYPDSVVAAHPVVTAGYPFSTEVFTFPECSWGRALRTQLATLVKRHDLGAIAFDVAGSRTVYRGPRLSEMRDVGWDGFGPGVVRGVGSAKLFDHLRTLSNRRLSGVCGSIVNAQYRHLSDILHADTVMSETTAWYRKPPYPLNFRLALGEKGLTLWEGYDPQSFDPGYSRWPKAARDLLPHDLCRYAVHRSFATGASLPACYLTEYVSLCSHAFVRMNDAGFKPVVGAMADGPNWELARYGLGYGSYIAICNGTNSARTASLAVFPGEIATGFADAPDGSAPPGFVYAPFFGGAARHTVADGGAEKVSCDVGPLLANVLECVGFAAGRGELSAEWLGDGVEARLAISSTSFKGRVMLRSNFEDFELEGPRSRPLRPGGRFEAVYREPAFAEAVAPVRRFAFMIGDRPTFSIAYAEDGGDSCDMADRIHAFFWSLTKPEGKAGRRHSIDIPRSADAHLPHHTVVLTDAAGVEIRLTSEDRERFSGLVRRFLNVVNAFRFPSYAPPVRMYPSERAYLPRIPRW